MTLQLRKSVLEVGGFALLVLVGVGAYRWLSSAPYCESLAGRVGGLAERDLVAMFGQWTKSKEDDISLLGLGASQGAPSAYQRHFGEAGDGRIRTLYWRLPRGARRYVWVGRKHGASWEAFDGIEYRGVNF